MSVVCYEIMHSGEGPRGKKVSVEQRPGRSANDYAEEAAHNLDSDEAFREGWDDTDQGLFHGGSHVIEVVDHPWHPEPVRFCVKCQVVRRYEARKLNG